MSPHGEAGVPAITDLTTRWSEARRAVPLPCHKRTGSSVGLTVIVCRTAEDGGAFVEGHGQVVGAPAGEGSAILRFVRGYPRRPRPADRTLNRDDLESALAHDDEASARAKRAEFGFSAAAEARSLPAARGAIPGQRGRFDRGGSIPAGAGAVAVLPVVDVLGGSIPAGAGSSLVHLRVRSKANSILANCSNGEAAFPQAPTCHGHVVQRIPSHFQGRGPQRPRRQSTRC
jgi:hypothetical protein